MLARPGSDDRLNAATSGGISHDEIAAELDSVATSAAFGKAERPARFLRHLVDTALRGESDQLKESVLGMDVFGRPASWDPRLDPIVRQEAARLRKRLAAYYQNGGAADDVRIELPVGSYVPVFRRKLVEIESPPLLTSTPAPMQVPAAPPSVERALARPRRVWPYAAAGILCIAAAVAAWRAPFHRESPPSIAVLPFANLSADPANQYFTDGLTDEITDSLSRLSTLRVIARSSSIQFKGKTVDVREAGRLLNVTNVLEGSIERSGDRVKIVVHLERTSDGSLLWSNTYERKASELFAMQSELAAGIAGSLKVAAGHATARHVPNAEAQDLVMKARYALQQMTPESLTQAESDFQRARDLDPEYPAAYLGLASVKYDRFAARGSVYQTEAERRSAEQSLRKALALDPELPAARAMLASSALQYDWDWAAAEKELQLAVAGPANATAETHYGLFLIFRDRFAEADVWLRRAQELDPFSIVTLNNLSLARILEGRYAEALEIAQRAAVQSPEMIAPQQVIGGIYLAEGRLDPALAIFRKLEPRFPQIRAFEAAAYAKAGRREEAMRLIRPFEEKYPNPGIPMQWIASFYAFLGDGPNALKWLERSADRHEWQALNLAVNPKYVLLHNSPGFLALKKRIGLER